MGSEMCIRDSAWAICSSSQLALAHYETSLESSTVVQPCSASTNSRMAVLWGCQQQQISPLRNSASLVVAVSHTALFAAVSSQTSMPSKVPDTKLTVPSFVQDDQRTCHPRSCCCCRLRSSMCASASFAMQVLFGSVHYTTWLQHS